MDDKKIQVPGRSEIGVDIVSKGLPGNKEENSREATKSFHKNAVAMV
jgi:hypothetical protein